MKEERAQAQPQFYGTSYPGLCTFQGEPQAATRRRDTSERGSKMTSGFSGKVGERNGFQREKRTVARTSEKVACLLCNQAVCRTGISPLGDSSFPQSVTKLDRANKQGVLRSIAGSDHCRCVSMPK